jgi:hypothetical protein
MPTTDQPDDTGTGGTEKPANPEQPSITEERNQQEPNPVTPPVVAVTPNQEQEEPAPVIPPATPEQPPVVQIVTPRAPGEIAQVEIAASSAGGVDVKEDVQKLGALPRAGLRLAMLVGSLIGVVTILVVIQWWRSAPWTGIPPDFTKMKSDEAKAVAENLKILSDTSVDRSLKLFDDIVGRVLLPVFTSILGYIFGTRGGDSSNSTPPNSTNKGGAA